MQRLLISITLSTALALLAKTKKALSIPGIIVALIFCTIITYSFGFLGFTLLTVSIISSYLVGKIKHDKRKEIEQKYHEKTGTRGLIQVLANVLISAILASLYLITKNEIYMISFACAITASLSDSMASDIGILAKGSTYNIIKRRKQEPGLSGGVSILGTISALITAFLMSIIYLLFNKWNIKNLIIITALGTAGCLIDSIIGELFQRKYKCQKCQIITEKKIHCEKTTVYQQGLKWINNDLVNFTTNIIVVLLAILTQITVN